MSALPGSRVSGHDLTPAESSRLAELEAVVERGMQTFVEVGMALSEIRDARLYRETHATFEDYCRDRWDFSDRRARQLISAAEIGTMVPVANERQARELARLDGEADVVEVWRELREEYGPDLTAKKVGRLVRKRLDRERREQACREDRERRRAAHEAQLVREINENGDGWKEETIWTTPRVQALRDFLSIGKRLDDLREQDCPTLSVCARGNWMPWVTILGAVRGEGAGTADRSRASDVLSEVGRFLLAQAEVVDLLREIDAAFEQERAEFLCDLEAWVRERSLAIGDSIEPLLLRLHEVADALPETEMAMGKKISRPGCTLFQADIRELSRGVRGESD